MGTRIEEVVLRKGDSRIQGCRERDGLKGEEGRESEEVRVDETSE